MAESRIWFVLVNCPDEAVASAIGREVLSAGLARMFNISGPIQSGYLWQGQLVETSEVQVAFKIDGRHRKALFERVKAQHPYEVPSIVAWPIDDMDADYRDYLTGPS